MISSVGHMSSICARSARLDLDQMVDAVERNAAVVADDAAAAVGSREVR